MPPTLDTVLGAEGTSQQDWSLHSWEGRHTVLTPERQVSDPVLLEGGKC